MVGFLVQWFPLLVFVTVIGLVLLAARLQRRISRSASSAGPAETKRAEPPGQQQTPWELQAIEDQLILARDQAHSI